MAVAPTKEQIAKLPVWAREHLRDVEREREVAVRELRRTLDTQTPSGFCYKDMACIGEKDDNSPSYIDRYVQTHKMLITHRGVSLDVTCPEGEDMRLQWSTTGTWTGEVAFIPGSHQNARLVAKENMR